MTVRLLGSAGRKTSMCFGIDSINLAAALPGGNGIGDAFD